MWSRYDFIFLDNLFFCVFVREGDCDGINDCVEGLKCGVNNCLAVNGFLGKSTEGFTAGDSCCYDPKNDKMLGIFHECRFLFFSKVLNFTFREDIHVVQKSIHVTLERVIVTVNARFVQFFTKPMSQNFEKEKNPKCKDCFFCNFCLSVNLD